MKLVVTGANGNTGRRIVDLALRQGHEVAAIVRDASTVENAGRAGLSVRANSFGDEGALVALMRGADVVINAAGNAKRGLHLPPLVQRVIRAASEALGSCGRFWCFGGAGVLDIPGARRSTLDLQKISAVFEAHRSNLNALQSTTLDWPMLCPERMIDAPDERATEGLRLSRPEWPVPRPGLTRRLPTIFIALAF